MAALLATSACAAGPRLRSVAHRPSVVCRATSTETVEKTETSTSSEPMAMKTIKEPTIVSPTESLRYTAKAEKGPSFVEVMAFNGKAPEIINARLAMLGFVHALVSEIWTGKTMVELFAFDPIRVAALVGLITYGSLVPILRNVKDDEAFGPFTPEAELKNGRIAMVAMAVILVLESGTCKVFF